MPVCTVLLFKHRYPHQNSGCDILTRQHYHEEFNLLYIFGYVLPLTSLQTTVDVLFFMFTRVLNKHLLRFTVWSLCFKKKKKRNKHSQWRESHQQSLECFKVHYIHGKRSCLDMKLTPAVCKFFPSAGVLQSKEPGVSKAFYPPTALHPKQTAALPWEQPFLQNMPNVFKTLASAFEVNSTWWRAAYFWFYFIRWTKYNTAFHIYIKSWGLFSTFWWLLACSECLLLNGQPADEKSKSKHLMITLTL